MRAELMLTHPKLLDKERSHWETATKRNCNDAQAWTKLADTQRALGDWAAALMSVRTALEISPDDHYLSQLRSQLSNHRVDRSLTGMSPCPIWWQDGFLSDAEQMELDQIIATHQNDFEYLGYNYKLEVDPDQRITQGLRMKLPFLDLFRDRLRCVIQAARPQLGVADFEIGIIETKLRSYGEGGFFAIHNDADHGRRLVFVYFHHREPKRFSGGDLVVFDSDPETRSHAARFTRIAPVKNRLVMIPSNFYHAVIPVRSIDKRALSFMDRRFAINGQIRQRQIKQ